MALKQLIPPRLRPPARAVLFPLYRGAMRLRCWCLDRIEQRELGGGLRLPPAMLRFRVDENPSARVFLDTGRKIAHDIQTALASIGRPFTGFDTVLDFGCGCGRPLIWLAREYPGKAFHGTDVDEASIRWCRQHLPLAGFAVNPPLPPTEYPDGMFDLILAISVFTHLDEEPQLRWLEELRRILRPGGVLLASLHGEHSWMALPREDLETLRRRGFLFKRSAKLRGIVPAGYHTAHHSRDYAERTFAQYFTVLSYREAGLGYQDLAALERRA
ncbi:MAG: class I SAM-dependent methyltransferase [Bryobacteraceae bacterium]